MRKEAIAADKERDDAAAIAKVKAASDEVKAADEGMAADEGHESPKEQEAEREPLSAEPLSAADETFRTQVR